MKTYRFIGLFVGLLALAGGGLVSTASAQVELVPNTIQGIVRFSNTNPAILDLLNPPNDEGMSSLYVSAYSLPPAYRGAGSDYLPANSRTETTYELAVDSDAIGIAYVVTPRVSMLGQSQTYYFRSGTSDPVVAFLPGPTVDFTECVGVLTVRFVDSEGSPLAVDGGNLVANEIISASEVARVHVIAGGVTEQRIYVLGGAAAQLVVTVNRGTSTFTDRIQYTTITNVIVPCDEFAAVDIVVPAAGSLGSATGTVDMMREFELTVDGYDAGDYADYTGVTAQYGPFGNTRYGAVPGVHFTTPASGTFILSNLMPSTLDPASAGYVVSAEMYFRTNEAISYFRTPALNAGPNPPLVVTPGASISLSNLFVIDPGYLRGRVFLQGPAESLGRESLLRGLGFASDYDNDGDGIPDGIGTYGIYYSTVAAVGAYEIAPGASFSAGYGYGYTGYKGVFNPATGAYDGLYEMPLGGLLGERSLWRRQHLNVTAYSGTITNDDDYFYYGFSVTDTAAPLTEIVPNEPATNDVAYCLSEVLVTFRSAEPFHSPNIRFSYGGFTNTDFQGKPASYSVYVDPAFGVPNTQAGAATKGQVLMYLPQGTYRLVPYITPSNSISASVSGAAFDVTVGCGERLFLDTCLQMNLNIPSCHNSGELNLAGSVMTRCSNTVVEITYELNGGPPVTVCNDCGSNPAFNLPLTLLPDANSLKVTAYDNQGGVTSVRGDIRPDSVPPVIQCPANATVEADQPCGATVQFTASATDNCDVAPGIICTPYSGSLFPRGDTVVTCVATDIAGNAAECSFTVTVSGGPEFPAPVISGSSPQLIGVAGGTQITVTGTDFTIDDEVLLDGVPLLYPVLVSAGEIQGQAPELPEGAIELQIRRCGAVVATLSGTVTVVEKPALTSVEPYEVYAGGGARVLVRGSNLRADTQVRVGFPAPDGVANLLRNVIVAEDGLSLTAEVPPLLAGELFGPRALTAEDARGQSVLSAALSYLPNPLETDPQVVSLRALEGACTEPPAIVFRNGFPVAMNVSVRVPGADCVERSRHFLRAYKDLLRQTNPDGDLAVRRFSPAPLEHVAFAQQYRGVPVFGGSVVVSLLGDEVLALTGSLLPPAPLDGMNFNPAPTLTAGQAEDLARLDLNLPGATLLNATHLQIFDECLLVKAALNTHLVWRVTLQGAHDELFIDAHTGAVVYHLPLSHGDGADLHGFDLDMQDAEDESNADDWCFNLSADENVANENGLYPDYANNFQAIMAFFHARDCYSFFHRRFNWHSYDNDSSQLEIFIRADVDNASWSGFCELMQIRDGWVDFEIIVHEFTHGVIRSTSDLIYKHQSGALNESYADMMAIIADREAGDNNWLLFENRTGVMGAGRDFQNVPIDRLSKYQELSEDDDNGGVHSNSGIANRAGYFMIAGGMTNGVRVLPMSQDKVRMLKWEALRNLPDGANFDSARAFEVATAIAWARTGTLGFNHNDVCTVRNAWAAVEVGWGDADCNGAEDRPSDIDRDFWPDLIDNCRNNANPGQEDNDGDRRGNVCDNCDDVPNPGQEDLDGDDRGDVCDDDIDGDGCLNIVDQHPNSATARAGSYASATCNPRAGNVYESEAGHHDLDGVLDCIDLDDDGDGIPDDQDPCPLVRGVDPGQCQEFRDCGLLRNDWWRACLFGGCNEFEARFRDHINPDPTREIVFTQVQIVNQTLYLQPSAGITVLQASRVIAPQLAPGRFAAAAASVWRVELWTRPVDGQPARLVAVVGDYDPATIQLAQTEVGTMLAFTPSSPGAPATLGATWHVGEQPSTATQDEDGDGLPDGWEIRYGLNRGSLADALLDSDGDGASNLAEYQSGTNPTDAASVFRILRLAHLPQEVRVEFVAPAGQSFQLEKATDLNQPDWAEVGPVLHAQGGVLTLSDTEPGATHGFYRVRLAGQ